MSISNPKQACPSSPLRGLLTCMILALLAGCSAMSRHAAAPYTAPAGGTSPSADEAAAVEAMKSGRLDDALARFKQLTAEHPDLAAAFIDVGLLQLDAGDAQAAAAAFERAVQLAPQRAEAYNGLGIAYRELGRFQDAEAAYLKAVDCAPDYRNAHLNLGILYDIYLDRPQDALAHYQRYKTLQGDDGSKVDTWIAAIKLAQAKRKEQAP